MENFKRNEKYTAIIDQIIIKIKKTFFSSNDGHDFSHLKRVDELVQKLQKNHGGSLFCLRVSAYLHDLHRLLECSVDNSLPFVKDILSEFDISKKDIRLITDIIAAHETFTLPANNNLSIECRIFQDADRLDALGENGLERTLMFGRVHFIPLYDPSVPLTRTVPYIEKSEPSTIHHIYNKLLQLPDYMNTLSARKNADIRIKPILAFFSKFMENYSQNIKYNIKRVFLSAPNKCKNACVYCFSPNSDKIYQDEKIDTLDKDDLVVFYPICDSELEFQPHDFLTEILKRSELFDCKTVISISTKKHLSNRTLQMIKKFNKKNFGRKLVKLTLSFTNKNRIEELEKGTLPFNKRIAEIKRIICHNIPMCIFIKPVLPFVEFSEYTSLIDELSKYTKDFVIGPLYVFENSYFYKKYINNKYNVEKKYSEWMAEDALIVVHDNYKRIIKYLKTNDISAYESDIEFIYKLVREGQI